MVSERSVVSKGGMTGGAVLAVCVGMLALPSAVMAFSTRFSSAANAPLDSLDADSSPDSLARIVALRSLAKGQPFPFTPAGTPNRPDRSVTVAVRVDPESAKAIIVHGSSQLVQAVGEPGRLRMAPTAFNLGVSRGYQNFSPEQVTQPIGKGLAEAPDLRKFSLQPGVAESDSSRFSTRLSIDEKHAPGRAPRTFVGEAGEVDLSGAYRVTKNIDVTAGVRYSQDRERLLPLTDGKQDGQAVYVGTQFHF